MRDATLVDRLKAGDEAVFSKLYSDLTPGLTRLCQSILGDEAAARDAVQECWLSVLGGIDGFRAEASLKNWIYRIAANKARDALRRAGRLIHLADETDGQADTDFDAGFAPGGGWRVPPALIDGMTAETIVSDREALVRAKAGIQALPAGERAALTLRVIDGLSVEETAEILGMTAQNVRVLTHRGRERLRQSLEPDLFTPASHGREDP